MDKISWRALAVVGLLLFGVFIAGCSDNAAPGEASPQPGVTGIATASGTLYSTGDIVKNPASTSGVALLITGYDPATDMYERAYIYPNSDGSFGYRLDSKTDPISRSVVEKVYTVKIRTIEVSAVPIGTAAVTTSAAAGAATVTTATTTTTTATPTTTTGPAPRIKGVEPDKGKTGTTVSITNLDGENFRSGANVAMKKYGETMINATNVVVTSNLITCKFVIPSGTETGYWDVVVTNTDGTSHLYQNGFLIQEGEGTTTTTTTGVPDTDVTITSLLDSVVVTGGTQVYQPMRILGTNLSAAQNMKFTRSGSEITGTAYSASSSSAQAFFTIPGDASGTYSVSVVDSGGNVLATLTDALTIRMS